MKFCGILKNDCDPDPLNEKYQVRIFQTLWKHVDSNNYFLVSASYRPMANVDETMVFSSDANGNFDAADLAVGYPAEFVSLETHEDLAEQALESIMSTNQA